jgi:hypothetical protein
MEDAYRRRIRRKREAAVVRKPTEFQDVPGEAEADAASDAILRNGLTSPASAAEALGNADAGAQTRAISRLQRERGNAYVQRVVAAMKAAPGRPDQSALLAGKTELVNRAAVERSLAPGALQPSSGTTVARTRSGGSVAVQRSFFGNLWKGIKSVGSAIGGAVATGARWVADRARDAGNWVLNLVRDLPDRLRRLGQTIVDGLAGVLSAIPDAIGALTSGGLAGFAHWAWERVKSGAAWALTLVSRVLDVVGGPEAAEFVLHLLSHSKPLSGDQVTAAQSVLGASAIRWNDIRIDEGGILEIIFSLNNRRAFTTFHTINMPPGEGLATAVHELTHVYQYERAGSVYIGQAAHAQAIAGQHAYDTGKADGLRKARADGRHFRDFNREQQAQIAEEYYLLLQGGGPATDVEAYDPFIAELKAGDL